MSDLIARLRTMSKTGWHPIGNEAADEIDRLNQCLQYEQHRAERVGTHWSDCYSGGPQHYECALREIDRLRARLEVDPRHSYDGIACRDETIRQQDQRIDRLTRERDEARAERDTLRAACKTTLMLRQLGGMMPGTKAVIDVAIHHAEEALAQIEQERSEQAKEG